MRPIEQNSKLVFARCACAILVIAVLAIDSGRIASAQTAPAAARPAPALFDDSQPVNREAATQPFVPVVERASHEVLTDPGALAQQPQEAQKSPQSIPLKEKSHTPLPLTKPGAADSSQGSASSGVSMVTIFGSLGIVLGLFFLIAWLMKRGMPRGMVALPSDVLEVLGRSNLAPRQAVHLIRCGNKLLLVSISTAGAETLTEITDPMEVDRIAGLCKSKRADSISATFSETFESLGRQRTEKSSRSRSRGQGLSSIGAGLDREVGDV